jgi:FkbM family methyltransferase
MSIDYSQPLLARLRRLGGKLGLIRPVVRAWRRLIKSEYEQAFEQALFTRIRSGDCVWDIGANVGHYSEKFAEVVGPSGHVIAFEPVPETVAILARNVQSRPNVTVKQVALSDYTGETLFFCDPGDRATASFLKPTDDAVGTCVPVHCGDEFLKSCEPNVVKIDVEGYEHEVLLGMAEVLRSPALRAIYVEVHFQVMADRGLIDGPSAISGLLRRAGFRVKWTDPSHIEAVAIHTASDS